MARRNYDPAATRRLLIDATFDSLVERGYHRTSTAEVCRRASLARGTMLHHFPTKQALVLAAIEDVLVRRTEEFQRELAQDGGAGDIKEFVRRLWSAIRGPTFMAWLELAVAARTDPALDAEFRAVMERFDALVVGIARTLPYTAPFADEDVGRVVGLVFSALNGLALDLLQKPSEEVDQMVEFLAFWVEAQFNLMR